MNTFRRIAALAGLALAVAQPAHAAYGWPVKPFHAQHPVRGYFGDPRIEGNRTADATLHFGVDVVAPDGTAVYATLDGTASIHPLHPDTVIVTGGAAAHEYWHVIPAVRPGGHVTAFRTVVGHVEAPWAHVHFSERHGATYVNPLRPGALTPFRDTTAPVVHSLGFERDGSGIGRRVSGRADVVVEARDDVPLAVAAPWDDKPVTPARVSWRIVGARASARWSVAVDFRDALPRTTFAAVYARWTRQNHPWGGKGVGRYRFLLARAWDSRSLPDGSYRLEVAVADASGNQTRAAMPFVVANGETR